MKTHMITVRETKEITYAVEADTKKQAKEYVAMAIDERLKPLFGTVDTGSPTCFMNLSVKNFSMGQVFKKGTILIKQTIKGGFK